MLFVLHPVKIKVWLRPCMSSSLMFYSQSDMERDYDLTTKNNKDSAVGFSSATHKIGMKYK